MQHYLSKYEPIHIPQFADNHLGAVFFQYQEQGNVTILVKIPETETMKESLWEVSTRYSGLSAAIGALETSWEKIVSEHFKHSRKDNEKITIQMGSKPHSMDHR